MRSWRERAGVLDLLPALAVRPGVQHATRAVLLLELGILRIVVGFRLFLGVQVVEVAEELVEPVHVGRCESRSPRWFLPNWPVA